MTNKDLKLILDCLSSLEEHLEEILFYVRGLQATIRWDVSKKRRKTKSGKPIDLSSIGTAITKHLGEVSKMLDAPAKVIR